MNAAFEDCVVLNLCLALFARDRREAAFQDFERRRKVHMDTLADLCIDNFIEMRDRVSSRLFRLKKKLTNLLHKLFPRWYVPLYTLVSFRSTPYADAVRRARIQDRIVGGLLAGLFFLMLVVLVLLFK
jgi:kynurenine 3-monooxygenase